MDGIDFRNLWLNDVSERHSGSLETIEGYKAVASQYEEVIGMTLQDIGAEWSRVETFKDVLAFKKKHGLLVQQYKLFLKEQNYAKGTKSQRISIVQSFYNSLPELTIDFGIPNNDVQYYSKDISRDQIMKILSQANPRDRAIFSLMAQSGMSPQNIVNLQWRHIKEDFEARTIEPYYILLPKEISKGSHRNHFSFYGETTKRNLESYFEVRGKPTKDNEYVFLPGTAKSKNGKVGKKSISLIFGKLVKELNLISNEELEKREGKPKTLRLYNLRKFFRKYGGLAGADFVNFWMGHTASYKNKHIPSSDSHYFSTEDIEFHRKQYSKALPHLQLGETESELMELKKSLAETEEKMNYLEDEVEKLRKVVKQYEKGFHFVVDGKEVDARPKWIREDKILPSLKKDELVKVTTVSKEPMIVKLSKHDVDGFVNLRKKGYIKTFENDDTVVMEKKS